MANTASAVEQTPIPPSGTTRRDPLVVGETAHQRRSRVLLGWIDEAEAVTTLLGRNPGEQEDVSKQVALSARSREAVRARSPYVETDVVVDTTDPMLLAIASRPMVQANFAPHNWRAAMVDLRHVLAFQKGISMEGHDARAEGCDDKRVLFEVCLPEQQPPPPLGAFRDADGKGFAIASTNPNLRIAGCNLSPAMVQVAPHLPPVPAQAMTVFVHMGMSYLQVVRYDARYFVRDGYHRATALLRRGINIVPAILIDARSFEEVGVPKGAFDHEVMFGERPPTLADFWRDDVAAEVGRVATKKVVRVRGDEFVVQQ